MPIRKVPGGWKWGSKGKVYRSRKGAERQAAAAYAAGYREESAGMRDLIEALTGALESAGGWAGQLSKQSRGSRRRPFVKKTTSRLNRRAGKQALRHQPGQMSKKSKSGYHGYAD